MSKFLNEGGYGCIYYPGIKCDGNPQVNKKVVSKLQRNNESAENEIKLGERIKAIPNYQLYFLPVIASCPVRLSKINPKLLTACSNISERDIEEDKGRESKALSKGRDNKAQAQARDSGYILMEVPYVLNKSFYTILIDMYASKKHVIIGIIENYTYLLEALETLLSANIVHFDVKSGNILYNQETHLPLILDFGLSIYIPDLTADTMDIYFYNYTPDYYIWPLEVHVINYVLYEVEGEGGLTEADVKIITKAYVQHNKGLTNFSEHFRKDYLTACETYLRTYVGKNKKKTIDMLLSFYSSWDNYALSILYLKTLSLMFPQGFHKNSLILYFSQMLLYNIHPDPAKRYTLAESKQRFKDIFFLEENVDNYVDFIETFDYDPELTTKAIQADVHQLSKTKAKMLKNKKRSWGLNWGLNWGL